MAVAVLCRVPTLEETLLQVCAEVCTSCPTLNAAQVAGCGTAFLVMVGTLLGPPPPVVGVGTTDFDRKRRHPDFPPEKKKIERNTLPAYPGLRAVHTPAITPVVGSKSTAAASWRAMLNEKASHESMFTLVETPRIGQRAVRITGDHEQILMALLAGAVGLLLLGKIVHKVLGRIGAGTGSSGAKMATLEENRIKLERIFQTPTQAHSWSPYLSCGSFRELVGQESSD